MVSPYILRDRLAFSINFLKGEYFSFRWDFCHAMLFFVILHGAQGEGLKDAPERKGHLSSHKSRWLHLDIRGAADAQGQHSSTDDALTNGGNCLKLYFLGWSLFVEAGMENI